jgi:hypothetical protein
VGRPVTFGGSGAMPRGCCGVPAKVIRTGGTDVLRRCGAAPRGALQPGDRCRVLH